jgi:hypothetical protein
MHHGDEVMRFELARRSAPGVLAVRGPAVERTLLGVRRAAPDP